MPLFNELYYFENPHKVLGKIIPAFRNFVATLETDQVLLDKTYLVVGPWKYTKDQQQIFQNGNFLHYDKGYFFHGKVPDYYRLSYGNLQEAEIFDCDDRRIKDFSIAISPWKKTGDYVLIVAPDEFPVQYYTDLQNEYEWAMWCKNEVRKYTDRKIFIRHKEKRKQRGHDPLSLYLKDAWAIVTHQSLACIESICYGVPVFNLAPSCCDSMALQDLSKIESPYYPENRWEWLKSLSYGQFTHEEITNGTAINILKERYG